MNIIWENSNKQKTCSYCKLAEVEDLYHVLIDCDLYTNVTLEARNLIVSKISTVLDRLSFYQFVTEHINDEELVKILYKTSVEIVRKRSILNTP